MKLHLQLVVLLGIGMIPDIGLFAASLEKAEAAGRQWAEQWLSQARAKLNPARPVNLKLRLTQPDLNIQTTAQRYNKPLITGPIALLINLSAAPPYPVENDFKRWIRDDATADMKQRHQKIIQDLIGYYQSRGYSGKIAEEYAWKLFHAKSTIYYPLVYRGSPDLNGLLKHNQTRNPYGTGSLANAAADNYNLGLICQKIGEHAQAAELYKQAAATGHARAQASLAYLYEKGEGVTRSAFKAVEFYTKAARQGHAVAQYNLGRIYQNGLPFGKKPVSSDPRQAEFYLQRAAAQGIVSAYHQLGVLYYNFGVQLTAKSLTEEEFQEWDTNSDKVISPQENRHLRDAHDHFLLAAQQQHGPALHALGVMYQQGHGVQSDPVKAVHWFKQATAYPQPDSYYNLAQLYENGQGTEVNLSRAFMLYQKAAKMGHAPSQYNIGLFYYQGRKAGSLVSINVPKPFASKHPENRIIDDMVSRDPRQNAVLAQATALYRNSDPSGLLQALDIFVDEEHSQFTVQVIREMLPANTPISTPSITPLGGDDPVQARAWWTLASEQKLQAAKQALALVNRVLTPEQAHLAKAIAATEKSRMASPPLKIPAGKEPNQQRYQVIDWGTGFFVSRDGFVITGKHLSLSGKRFQITTENGIFPAQVVPVKGDLNHYLLLKVQGEYNFQALSLASSYSTRLRDEVKVLGYQMPAPTSNGKPHPIQAKTHIKGILGAQADPRFFHLQEPVLGDQLYLRFDSYLDDAQTRNEDFGNSPELQSVKDKRMTEEEAISKYHLKLINLQALTVERIRGALRSTHLLLGTTDISIGYRLKTELWYDAVGQKWLSKPDTQNRARLHSEGSWVVIDSRKIVIAPPKAYVEENQAMIRLSVAPEVVRHGNKPQRLSQLAVKTLDERASGVQINPQLEKLILAAKISVIKSADGRTGGFRGAALMNRRGQAIGLFFPSLHDRSPDVFRNFSSYHRYMLKSDHLLGYLNRAPNLRYETRTPEIPQMVSSSPAPINSEAYLLAKAQASMVLVEVLGDRVLVPSKGGTK